VCEFARASPRRGVKERFLIITGMKPWVRESYRWQAWASGRWLGPAGGGEVVSGVAEGSGVGKVNGFLELEPL